MRALSTLPSLAAAVLAHCPAQGADVNDLIRVAVFEMTATDDPRVSGRAASDFVALALAQTGHVELVNRTALGAIAQEHKFALAGVVDAPTAVRVGRLASADFIVTGGIYRIGKHTLVVVRLTEVETSIEHLVAGEAGLREGPAAALQRALQPLLGRVATLRRSAPPDDRRFLDLRKRLSRLTEKRVAVIIQEAHVSRRLADPAALTRISARLTELGLPVVRVSAALLPSDLDTLHRTGRLGETPVDLLVIGEAVSEFAARLEGMVCCRARVELQLFPIPGQTLASAASATASGIDLAESIAAKSAVSSGADAALAILLETWLQDRAEQAQP